MALWRFYDYSLVGTPGMSEIDTWLAGRDAYIVQLEAVLIQLRNLPLAKWNVLSETPDPPFRWMNRGLNAGLGLGELRYSVYAGLEHPTQRPICWVPHEGKCVLLVGMEKHTRPGETIPTQDPRAAERTARSRREDCVRGVPYLLERHVL